MTTARASRRGVPLAATVLTLVMLPILLGLSYWQFAIRRPWKAALIAQLEAARSLPPVTASDYFHAMLGEADLQYRRAEVDCRPGRVKPYDVRGGTSAAGGADGGTGGFLVLVDCNDPARHRAPDLVVVAGWTLRPDRITALTLDTRFSGTLIEHPYGKDRARPQFMLIPTTAVAPLAPVAAADAGRPARQPPELRAAVACLRGDAGRRLPRLPPQLAARRVRR